MSIVLGIDGGGTKTHAAAFSWSGGDSLGEPLAERTAGACNIAFMPLDEAVESIRCAAEGLGIGFESVDAVCAAVAGFSFISRRIAFASALQSLFPRARILVTSDCDAAFRGALPDNRGLLVIAGTGSVAKGADGAGAAHRAGGYGYLIDDGGTGYGVGRSALAAVLQAIDGTGEATALSDRFARHLKLSTWDGFIEAVYGGSVDRVGIAALARIVAQAAAEDGDEISRRILMRAGGSLARQAEAVHERVFGAGEAGRIPIVRVGGLWEAGAPLNEVFERSCLRFAPGAEFVSGRYGPVYGAGLMAVDLLLEKSLAGGRPPRTAPA